jgi:uncharacterized damage-inducible protein DinB
MPRTLIHDAFEHHTWATVRLADACLVLSPQQLATAVPGTYGSILDTMRHLVGSDSFELFVANGERTRIIDTSGTDLAGLRAAMEETGAGWSRLLETDLDPEALSREVDPDDGFQRDAPLGMRLAQVLHHGNEHRTQVCTTLTTLGIDPPGISVWHFGQEEGRTVERTPTP